MLVVDTFYHLAAANALKCGGLSGSQLLIIDTIIGLLIDGIRKHDFMQETMRNFIYEEFIILSFCYYEKKP